MIIDFHTHTFSEKIAAHALDSLSGRTGGLRFQHKGTVDGLKTALKEAGADGAVILNVATNPKKISVVNDYAIETNCPEALIWSFGSVHPFAPDALEELERLKAFGVRGIKFQPAFQQFYADDPKAFPLYRKAAQLGFVTVFHSGLDLGFREVFVSPQSIAAILPQFDGAPVVAAHFGGYMQWEDTLRVLLTENVYLDTSYSYGRMPFPMAVKLTESFGADRILFGSDSPWGNIADEIRFFRHIGLSDAEEEKVFSKNALSLLK